MKAKGNINSYQLLKLEVVPKNPARFDVITTSHKYPSREKRFLSISYFVPLERA